jgi:hypothetical protein
MKNSFMVSYSSTFEADLSTHPGYMPKELIAANPISPTRKWRVVNPR